MIYSDYARLKRISSGSILTLQEINIKKNNHFSWKLFLIKKYN